MKLEAYYSWNQPETFDSWSHASMKQFDATMTPKTLLKDPSGVDKDQILRTLCKTVHELTEHVEELRNAQIRK